MCWRSTLIHLHELIYFFNKYSVRRVKKFNERQTFMNSGAVVSEWVVGDFLRFPVHPIWVGRVALVGMVGLVALVGLLWIINENNLVSLPHELQNRAPWLLYPARFTQTDLILSLMSVYLLNMSTVSDYYYNIFTLLLFTQTDPILSLMSGYFSVCSICAQF